jgi:DNA polymerase/3'-5' exonuclease PolX
VVLVNWTGSTLYLRMLKVHANQQGFWLGNHTLVRLDSGEPVAVPSEEAVFTLLGVPYHRPEERCA